MMVQYSSKHYCVNLLIGFLPKRRGCLSMNDLNALQIDAHEVEQRTKYFVLIGVALITFAFGFYFTPNIRDLAEALKAICLHHSLANSDFMAIPMNEGLIGGAFINCGLLILCTLATYYVTDTKVMGTHYCATGIVAAYSFYTKNIFNVWGPVIGVFLYAAMRKRPLKEYSNVAWFASVLGIITSATAFYTPALLKGTIPSIVWGVLFGIIVGIMSAALCRYMPKLHRGYTVFNLGFSTGVAIVFMFSLYKAIGWSHDSYSNGAYLGVTTKSYNLQIGIFLTTIFLYQIIVGYLIEKNKQNIKPLVLGGFKGGDYDAKFGFGSAMFNCGCCGFVSMFYALATGWIAAAVPGGTAVGMGQLSGPAIAGIITVGMWPVGVTPRTYGTLILGVYTMSFLGGGITGAQLGKDFIVAGTAHAAGVGQLVVSGFVVGICPIPGDLGFLAGYVAGLMHTVMAQVTGAWHGWMTSYNNGFAGGLICVFCIPMLMLISKNRRHEKLY